MKTLFQKIISPFIFLLITQILSISITPISAQTSLGLSFIFSTVAGVSPPPVVSNIAMGASPTAQDDSACRISPAGMNVRFQGRQYTSFVVSTNGWVALLPAGTPAGIPATLSQGGFLNNNQLSNNTSGFPILAPYWDDLSCTILQWNWTAPTLTVQWFARINKTAPTAAANFLVKINGTTGVITFSYSNNGYVAVGHPNASIGVAGVCTGDYYSYDNVSTFADSTIETTTIGVRPNNIQYLFTPYQINDSTDILSFSGLDTVNCINNIASILVPSHSPGTFSGPGIFGNTFDPSLAGIGTHTITYEYTTAGGCLYTASQSTRVDACLTVPIHQSISLEIFPNPNSGEFYLKVQSNGKKFVQMNIRDLLGRILMTEELNLKTGENKIPFHSTLAKGIYLLSISDESGSESLKMIVD